MKFRIVGAVMGDAGEEINRKRNSGTEELPKKETKGHS